MSPLQHSSKTLSSSASDSSSSPARRNTRHSRNASVSRTRHVYGLVAISCLVFLGSVRAQGTGPGGAAAGPIPLLQQYCSSSNTADYTEPYTSTYMSLGLCKTHCISNYAFAVVQGKQCWCSNIVPDKQLNVNESCGDPCPGFPDNLCGGTGAYGYLALSGHSPSGTAGASSVRTSDTDDSTTTISRPVRTTSIIEPDDPSSSSQTPTPVVSVVTLAGSTQTITIAPTAGTYAGMASSSVHPQENFFSNAGRVAGVFVVIALAIIGFVLLLLWWFFKKRRANKSRYGGAETPDSLGSSNGDSRAGGTEGSASANPKRKSRSMSTLGLVGAFNSEKNLPTIATTPATGGGPSSTVLNQMSERFTDQRLDPHQVWLRFDQGENASRVSVRSLRDDHDYSRRVLRLTNPDGDL